MTPSSSPISKSTLLAFERIVGSAHVSVGRAQAEIYSYDASLAKGAPDVVVFPADAAQTARVIQAAHRAATPFVPRGFGTNLSGGTVLSGGGLVVCLTRLNRILSINPDQRSAVVQPGVTNLELQTALAAKGFFYAPDPASQKVATLGGNLGENSGGPRCLKYGVTTNHILGMEFVTPEGRIFRFGGAGLDPPGYDLRGIVVGAEGTLGVVTEVTVRILPKAQSVITMLAVYNDIADAAHSVSDIISAGIVPATLEMMDRPIINAVEDSYACGYPRDAAAVLIIEVEGPAAGLKDQAGRIRDICMENGCRRVREAKDEGQRNRLWEGRRGAFGAVARLAPNYLVNDCTVPRTRLPQALARVAQITAKYGFDHGNVFHAGDGNLHPLIFFDSRDADQLKRVKKAGWEIMEACVALGGTISGEHGIGLEKMDAMHLIFSDHDLAAQRRLKQAFDPENLLNPGKVIPDDAAAAGVKSEAAPTRPDDRQAEREIAARIRRAYSQKQAILPLGSGTHRQFGNLDSRPATPVFAKGLEEIGEYDPPNQVVRAGAAMKLTALQRHLEPHGQWLPLRPLLTPAGHTLGGLAALGACGPERMFYGAPRDLLLGLRFINGLGDVVAAGGKVVKNVAGYDLTRLMAGSAGTLGFITELTWRISTRPQRSAAFSAEGSLSACNAAAASYLKSDLAPAFVCAVSDKDSDRGGHSGPWTLVVGYEGFSDTVDYQLEQSSHRAREAGLNPLDPFDYPLLDGPLRSELSTIDQSDFLLRAQLPPDRLRSFMRSVTGQTAGSPWFADFGCGSILAALPALSANMWKLLRSLARQTDASLVLEKAPDEFKQQHDVFGPRRPEWDISHRIKAALDPGHIFAPGRLPGKV